jgi:hypothetical protein
VYWTKKVIHMPIAERYLLLALTLLTRRPMLVLWTLFIAVCVAVLWTQGGRVAAVLLRRDPTWGRVPVPDGPGHLDAQLDLGPLARGLGRKWHSTFPVGFLGAVLLVVGPGAALWFERPAVAALLALVGAAIVGAGWQPPVHHPLGWQAPAALWVAEVLAVGLVVHHSLGLMTAAGFAYLAAIAYHRYDVVYRLRDTGTAPGVWLTTAGLGVDGRMLLLLLLTALAPSAVVSVLWVAAVVLAVLYVGESAVGWRSWIAAHPPSVPAGGAP